MKTFKKGGIHPGAEKLSGHSPIRRIATPAELTVILSQSIGKPAIPVVKAGDAVVCGGKIADADGFVSAPLHSPVDGTVKKIERVRTPQGEWTKAIIISTDPDFNIEGKEFPKKSREEIEVLSPSELRDMIGNAGIVGLGGATFPTKVKLSPPPGELIHTLIVNGAECEPYLTCDDLLMQEKANEITEGIILLMRAAGVEKAIIGIEENKPEAISAMRSACADKSGIKVEVLRKKYPQGGEKEMIEALTGEEVPPGALPASVGVIVDNVATAYAVYEAICLGKPLIERVITVTGPDVSTPSNILAPIGTPIETLIESAGGIPGNTGKIIAGGPMMGRAISIVSAPSTKGTSGVLVLPAEMSVRRKERPCIRCARCISVCPMGLEPYLLIAQAKAGLWEDMKNTGALNCIECGSCAYSCPAAKPLLDYIRLGKKEIRKL